MKRPSFDGSTPVATWTRIRSLTWLKNHPEVYMGTLIGVAISVVLLIVLWFLFKQAMLAGMIWLYK